MPVLLNPHAFGGGGGGGGGTYPSEVQADSPLAYWRLGDAAGTTMTDSSGNARHGTYVGSPLLGATGLLSTDADTCVDFDANNDHGDLAYAAWMDASTALTTEALIRPAGVNGDRPIIDRDHSSGRVFQFRVSTGKLQFIKIGGTGGIVTATSVTSIAASTTYHVAATYDGSNIRLYINGALDKTQAAPGTLGTGNSPLMVGASFSGTSGVSNLYSGKIDEAAIYGSVLSSARIADHYAAA